MKKIFTLLTAFFALMLVPHARAAETGGNVLDFTVSPSYTEEIAKMPSTVSITINGYEEINPSGCKAHMTGPDGFDKLFTVKNREHRNTITFTIAGAADITTAGEYNVTIPTEALLVGFDNLGTFEDITFTYKLGASAKPEINYVVNPAGGDITEFPNYIQVTFPDETLVSPVSDLNPAVRITGPAGYDKSFSIADNTAGNTITVTVDEEIFAVGEYVVTIPTNALVNADNANLGTYADIVFKYNLKAKPSADIIDGVPEGYTVFPEPGSHKADELVGEFKITLNGFATATDNVEGNYVKVFGPAGEKVYTVKNGVRKMLNFDTNEYYDVPDVNSLAFEVAPKDFASPGTYTMTATLFDVATDPADMGRNFKWEYVVENTTGELPEAIVDIQPAPGEVTDFPSEIKVTYKGQLFVFPRTGENTHVTITGPGDYNQKFAAVNTDVTSEISNTITINVDPVPTAAGEYTVTVSGNALNNGNDETLDQLYKDVAFTYTVLEKEPTSKYGVQITPDPKAGVYEKLPEFIVVKFPKLLAVTGKDNKLGITMNIDCDEHNIHDAVYSEDNENNYKGYNFTLEKEYTLPGTYTCTVDFESTEHEAWFDSWTKTLLDEVVVFKYTVSGVSTSVSPEPGERVKLETINITVNNATEVSLSDASAIKLMDKEGQEMPVKTSLAENVITVTATPAIITEGEFTLTVPGGTIIADGEAYDKDLNFVYTVKPLAPITNEDGVIVAPHGEKMLYLRNGKNYAMFGDLFPMPGVAEDVVNEFVYGEDGEVYMKNILSSYPTKSYVKGTLADGVITVEFPQLISVATNESGEKVKYYADRLGKTVTSDNQVSYEPAEERTIKFTVAEDGTITMEPSEYEMMMLGLTDENGIWLGYGDVTGVYTKFSHSEPLTMPEDLETEEYLFVADGLARYVSMGIDNKDLYIKGISVQFPDACVKGTITDDNKVVFENGQYLGYNEDIASKPLYFVTAEIRTSATTGLTSDYKITDEAVFDFDPETKAMSSKYALLINGSVDKPQYSEYFRKPLIHKNGTNYENIPANILFVAWSPWNPNDFWCGIQFRLPNYTDDYNYLSVDNIYWRMFVNGKLMEFDPEHYTQFTSPQEWIPFNADSMEIQNMGTALHTIILFEENIDTIGVQSKYDDGNECNLSDIMEYEIATGKITNKGKSGVETVTDSDASAVRTEYYTLDGIRVDNMKNGIYVKRTTMSDGTIRTSKVVVK